MKFRKLACTVLAGAAILGLAACGNSGGSKDAAKSGGDGAKTEITWWAFPVFTQEKQVMVLEHMKNQSSRLLKKQIQM